MSDETCWADDPTSAERHLLAPRIARASRFFGAAAMELARSGENGLASLLNAASADMSDLHLDLTERAAVWTRCPRHGDVNEHHFPCRVSVVEG